MVDPVIQPEPRSFDAFMSARSTAPMHIMHTHQEQIHMASQSSRHSTQNLHLADMVMSALHRPNPSNTAYPYQQDEVFNAVKHVSKTIHHINKHIGSPHINQNSSQLPSGRQQIWHAVMTAKYHSDTHRAHCRCAVADACPRGLRRPSPLRCCGAQGPAAASQERNGPHPPASRFSCSFFVLFF